MQQFGGDMGIAGGGVELLMAEQDLDDADIDFALEQVSGKAMTTMSTSE